MDYPGGGSSPVTVPLSNLVKNGTTFFRIKSVP
jgi:hypothetical protein